MDTVILVTIIVSVALYLNWPRENDPPGWVEQCRMRAQGDDLGSYLPPHAGARLVSALLRAMKGSHG